jgi:ribosome-binding ATPase YchF (GTP1/OBG family)
MKKIFMIVGDVDLIDNTREVMERLEGEDLSFLSDTQEITSLDIHKYIASDVMDIVVDKHDMLRVYPIADFTTAVNDDDEIFTDSFISYVTTK